MKTVATNSMKGTNRKFDSVEQEAYLSIWRTYDRLRSFDESLFAEFGLTAQQYNVLRILQAASPKRVPTLSLSDKLVSRAPDVTRMLDRLEQETWIRRSRSTTDRRTVLVEITSKGSELIELLHERLMKRHKQQLGHLTKTELKQLCQLLRKARQPHEDDTSPWR